MAIEPIRPIALVLGAGTRGNIGYATASRLDESGYKVVVGDIDFDHDDFIGIGVDVTKQRSVEEMMDIIRDEFGELSILVNSVGVNILGPIEDYDLENFQKSIDVNLTSNFLLLQSYINHFDGDGLYKRFVVVTSDTAMIPKSSSFAYGASKAGANQFLRCAAREINKYHDDNWLITGLALGRVKTPMDSVTIEDLSEQRGITKAEAEKMLNNNIPLNRGMEPDEVSRWITFLVQQGSFASGNILRVDGGQVQG